MFLGPLIALILEKKKPEISERFVVPVSSGFIAGESIMGIVGALLGATGLMEAMMSMKQLDIVKLQKAFDGK